MIYQTTRWLLFACGVSLPLTQFHAFDVAVMYFTMNKVLTALLLGWAVIFWLGSRRPYPTDRKLPWVALLFAAMMLSLFTSFLSGAPVARLVNPVISLSSVIAFYLLLAYIVVDIKALDTLLVGYLVGIVIASISVISAGGPRTGGLGGDPNAYAYHAAIGLAVILMYFTMSRSVAIRGVLIGVGLVALIGVMASLSRGGAVAVAAMLGLWVVRFRQFAKVWLVIPAAAVLGGLVLLASPEWMDRMNTMNVSKLEEADSSTRTRVVIGEFAVRAFVNDPAFGVGYGGFGPWAMKHLHSLRQTGRAAETHGTEVSMVGAGKAIHNSYLHVAAEMGLLGLIPYLAFLGLSWLDYSRAWKLARRYPRDPILSKLYLYALFLQMALFAALVDNLTLSSLRYKGQWMVLALSTVVLFFTRQRIRTLSSEEDSPEGLSRAPLLPEVPPLPGVAGSGGSGFSEGGFTPGPRNQLPSR